MRYFVFQGDESRIVEQRRQPEKEARRTDPGGTIVAGAIECSERFVLVAKCGVDRGDVGTVGIMFFRESFEIGQDFSRTLVLAELCVTDRELEVRLGQCSRWKRFVTFHCILPAARGSVDIGDRIDIVKKARIDFDDSFSKLQRGLIVALRNANGGFEYERPGIKWIERTRTLQFGAAADKISFDPRQIPTKPSMRVG